jgi:hypothetical protein
MSIVNHRSPIANVLGAALLVLLPLLIHSRGLGFGPVDPDDQLYFRLNPALHDGRPQGALDVWKAPYLHDYFPVTQTTIWADLALFGTESWWGSRLHALLWFILGAFAVRALVARLTGSPGLALVVAIWYAVHPVCTHAVMWLAERKNLVCLALCFWCLERYVASRQSENTRARRINLGVAWLLSVLALLAKPHAVALPVMLASYEVLLGRGAWRWRAARLALFVASAALYLVLTFRYVVVHLERYALGGGLLGVFVSAGVVLARYLWHTIAPTRLAFFYAKPELPPWSPFGWGAWALVALLALGTVWLARRNEGQAGGWKPEAGRRATRTSRRNWAAAVPPASGLRPAVCAFGWLFGLAALSPALNFAPQQLTALADQYHQWALPGWLMSLALSGWGLLSGSPRLGWCCSSGLQPPASGLPGAEKMPASQDAQAKKWAAFVAGALALCWGLLALARVADYRSPLALAAATVEREPGSALAWARYTRVLAASEDRDERHMAGIAGLRALHSPDADRIQLQERALAVTEAAVLLYRGGKEQRAAELLAGELPRFARLPLPFADLIEAEVAARTGRPELAVERLARYFTPAHEAAAEQLRRECRGGARGPDALPPLTSGAPPDWAAHQLGIWSDFERRLLLVLAQAYLDRGESERAWGVAAVLLNAHPRDGLGRQLLAKCAHPTPGEQK